MENLKWSVKKLAVGDLKIWKNNPRKISKESLNKLKERIVARGFHDVIKIDLDNTILSGNQRKKVLEDLGVKEITVIFPNRKLTKEEKEKVALESNVNDGNWDIEKLKELNLDTVLDIDSDDLLRDLWYDSKEVEDDDFDEKSELKKIKTPQTKLGDLIILGNHKLLCGDSTDPNNLKKLFGQEKCSMVYSDPVFNLKGGINYNSGVGGKKNYGGNVNDNKTDEEYEEFIKKSLESALLVAKKDIHVFYWSDSSYIWLIQTLYRELGINNKRVCLWIKQGQNPTPGVAFSKCYEPCTYGVIGKPFIAPNIQNLNEVMNNEMTTGNEMFDRINDYLDIWTERRLSGKEMEHATSKPPQLHSKAIRRCSRPGDIILDSFGGSGSTLIAAEQLKRRAFLVELEPVFCDLIIRRFEKLTGIKAKVM